MNRDWHEGHVKGLQNAATLAHGMAYVEQACDHPCEAAAMAKIWERLKLMVLDAEAVAKSDRRKNASSLGA